MATITDYFNKAGNSTTTYPVQAVVSQARAAGDTVLTCQSLTGWATDTPVHFTTYKVGTDGAVNVGSQTDWKGIVVNNTITQMTRLRGASDAGNAIGDIVELNPTIGWLDDLITGLLVTHTQSGTLKSGSVGTSALANNAVTASKIDFSTLAQIKYYTFTGTTDNNGFVGIPTTVLTPSLGIVIGANIVGRDAFLLPFCASAEGRITIRILGWDLSPIASTSVTITVAYIPKSLGS